MRVEVGASLNSLHLSSPKYASKKIAINVLSELGERRPFLRTWMHDDRSSTKEQLMVLAAADGACYGVDVDYGCLDPLHPSRLQVSGSRGLCMRCISRTKRQ